LCTIFSPLVGRFLPFQVCQVSTSSSPHAWLFTFFTQFLAFRCVRLPLIRFVCFYTRFFGLKVHFLCRFLASFCVFGSTRFTVSTLHQVSPSHVFICISIQYNDVSLCPSIMSVVHVVASRSIRSKVFRCGSVAVFHRGPAIQLNFSSFYVQFPRIRTHGWVLSWRLNCLCAAGLRSGFPGLYLFLVSEPAAFLTTAFGARGINRHRLPQRRTASGAANSPAANYLSAW